MYLNSVKKEAGGTLLDEFYSALQIGLNQVLVQI